MRRARRSLRVQLAVLGFLAIYVPVLVLLGVFVVTERQTVEVRDGVEVTDDTVSDDSEVTGDTVTDRPVWAAWTAAALGPTAAGLAWWWSGRAVRPINRVRAVAEDIEATDLGRRIGLDQGPTEVVSLAAAFDAMLDRLQDAADTQRQLVEETSHELRTPLSVLMTNADVLLALPDPTIDTYRQGLERSKSAAERLRSTVDELLVAARGRVRTIDRQPADLVAVVRGVVEDAPVLAGTKDITVTLSGPTTAPCSVDPATVRRAVSNLVDNAIRYAPDQSTVEVDVTAASARVVVTDHGPGIAPDDQAHIFERFWRGRYDADGAGLGLPIAKQIAVAHGGDLTVRSPGPDGDGCVFELSLSR